MSWLDCLPRTRWSRCGRRRSGSWRTTSTTLPRSTSSRSRRWRWSRNLRVGSFTTLRKCGQRQSRFSNYHLQLVFVEPACSKCKILTKIDIKVVNLQMHHDCIDTFERMLVFKRLSSSSFQNEHAMPPLFYVVRTYSVRWCSRSCYGTQKHMIYSVCSNY